MANAKRWGPLPKDTAYRPEPGNAPCPWLPALKTAEQAVSDLREAMRRDGYTDETWLDSALVDLTRLRFQKEGKA